MRRVALLACTATLLLASGTAGAQAPARSWAAPHIEAVVQSGLMGPSVAAFRPQDPLTEGELATILVALGEGGIVLRAPERPVTVRELDARLVAIAGLRPQARAIRRVAAEAGLRPTPWLGTETVARLLGLRVNHARENEHLELQLSDPVTRAEAAYSLARLVALEELEVDAVLGAVSSFSLPQLDQTRRAVLQRALRLVGSPYVWGGSSEHDQMVGSKAVPGGFDCSGLVWRVYKLPPLALARPAAEVLRGRTSYAMSGEVPRRVRVSRAALQPGDVVFFGARGPRSRPAEVGHMGIYVGNGWIVHSSRNGTTLQPLTDWYDTSFAWGRNLLAEAGVALPSQGPAVSTTVSHGA